MAKYSEAQKKAVAKYKEKNYKRIPYDVPAVFAERIRAAASATNESVNGYITTAVKQRLERDSSQ